MVNFFRDSCHVELIRIVIIIISSVLFFGRYKDDIKSFESLRSRMISGVEKTLRDLPNVPASPSIFFPEIPAFTVCSDLRNHRVPRFYESRNATPKRHP